MIYFGLFVYIYVTENFDQVVGWGLRGFFRKICMILIMFIDSGDMELYIACLFLAEDILEYMPYIYF